jgi:hypothetical protein
MCSAHLDCSKLQQFVKSYQNIAPEIFLADILVFHCDGSRRSAAYMRLIVHARPLRVQLKSGGFNRLFLARIKESSSSVCSHCCINDT